MPSFEFLIGHFLLEEGADENAIAVAAFYPSYWWHWLNYLLGVFCGIKVFFIFIPSNDHHMYLPKRNLINQ